MKREITVHEKEDDLPNWVELAALLKKVGVIITSPQNGVIKIKWDDETVDKAITRDAGNNWIREDILIEDIIKLMDKHWRRGYHRSFPEDHNLGISYATFRKRLNYFEKKYGSLQEAVDAGCKYFTDRPDRQNER